ncbi:MAG TPA: tyrosine-protein phosphatase [Desulfosalsimonadaceae bacterium]|nr:tyrosine-protein phosphatase [Desulfosalsimonadaceae bacterium]
MGSTEKRVPQALSFAETAVYRRSAGTVEICWPADSEPPVAVYVRNRQQGWEVAAGPERISKDSLTISGRDLSLRPFFKIVAGDGSCVIAAERRMPLEGAVNFRDIGGYQTTGGRLVRWGRVFRSDGLYRLTDADLAVLSRLEIRHVFDFRTASEAANAPNRLPEAPPVAYHNLPVSHGKFDFVQAVKRLKAGDTSWLTPDFMMNGYLGSLSLHGETWGRVIRHIAGASDGATVFHCTGGKDRTGACAALLLLALGVPEETVIADHQLSNHYIAELLPKINQMLAAYGVDPDILLPYLTAPRECIITFLDALNARYGSAAAYLQEKGGLFPETLEQLRETLLEPECP